MRVMSYSIVHYGKDFLPYALKSVYPFVEKSYVLYTSHPSHGHSSELINPESRDEIMASIPADQWGKLTWVDTDGFWNEGPQRDYAVKTLTEAGADIILVTDYDEIHYPDVLEKMLKEVWDRNISRNWLCNMVHFWKSFNFACLDDGWPVRLIDTRHRTGTNYISPTDFGKILHFGYAIKNETMRYKLSLHGHKDELRPNWYEEKWLAWPPPKDCHPTNGIKQDGTGWWDPVPFDKALLPEFMRRHPFYNLDKIE